MCLCIADLVLMYNLKVFCVEGVLPGKSAYDSISKLNSPRSTLGHRDPVTVSVKLERSLASFWSRAWLEMLLIPIGVAATW